MEYNMSVYSDYPFILTFTSTDIANRKNIYIHFTITVLVNFQTCFCILICIHCELLSYSSSSTTF